MLGGGLYASARLGVQPQVGSVAEVSRFSTDVGLETRPGPIHPTPGMGVASLVCALASLSVWWRHGEWAPFLGYPLARGPHQSPAAPPPPPPTGFQPRLHLDWKTAGQRKHGAMVSSGTDIQRSSANLSPSPPQATLTNKHATQHSTEHRVYHTVPDLPL